MPNKRDTSKQKRARENRAQREARLARTKAATMPRPSRVAPSTAAKLKPSEAASGSSGTKDAAGTPRKKQGFLAAGREARASANRPGDRPVELDELEGNFLQKVAMVPGGRQVLFAVAMTVVATVLTGTMDVFVPAGSPEDAKASLTIFDQWGAKALFLLIPPLVVVGVALVATLHPKRRLVWNICTFLLAGLVLLTGGIGINYLFSVGFLGYAILRASKVEGPTEGSIAARIERRAEARAAQRAGAAEADDEA